MVTDGMERATEQARESLQAQTDPHAKELWSTVVSQMDTALKELKAAKSSDDLAIALTAQEAAYDALLKLRRRESEISKGKKGESGSGEGEQASDRQMEQLDLEQSEKRYETQRDARATQNPEQREQQQVMNRLAELARRQEDMNSKLKELQTALLAGTIDCAVHSLKDVPEDEPEGLILAAFPEREDARDVFVSDGRAFRLLPAGAKVGTGSPRRVLQLKALRPDLEYVAVRGNVDTRIGKVRSGELQGVVLAAAGMRRLGLAAQITHPFSFQDMIPAIGQASLGIECRSDDARVRNLLEAIDDAETHDAVSLERDFMKRIGGGCKVPMAAHAYPYGDGMRMLAVLGNPATGVMARVEQTLEEDDEDEMLEEIAVRMEEECREKGIPLPHDLPAHFLLTRNPPAGKEP